MYIKKMLQAIEDQKDIQAHQEALARKDFVPWEETIKELFEMHGVKSDNLIKKRFYFVRHGETDWNKNKLCQGHTDIALNDVGRGQAQALGEKIGTLPFCSIYTSPLKRAHETAVILNKALPHLSLTLVDHLKERHYGQLEGGPSFQMYEQEEQEQKNPGFFQEKGIEPRDKFKERILLGINRALESAEVPLIVSHGRVFMTLCEILGLPLLRQVPNTTLYLCEPTQDGWSLQAVEI